MKSNYQFNKIGQIVSAMQNSKGRYFGLTTKTGEVLNAQFRNATQSTVTVYDRNSGCNRRFLKSSLSGYSMGGVFI